MTAAEETYWIARYKREPFGDHRSDVAAAQIAHILWNTNVKKDDRKKLEDFLPFYRAPVKKDPFVNQKVRSFFGKLVKRKDG